jgi:DNA-binding NtrC family response regulator
MERGESGIISVLCVFEDPLFLDRICRHLESNGDIFADISVSVEDALHLMVYVTFDAVVTDVLIRDGQTNGFLKSVRDTGNGVPFICMIRPGNAVIEAEARAYGAVYFVPREETNPSCGFERVYQMVKRGVSEKKKSLRPGNDQRAMDHGKEQ